VVVLVLQRLSTRGLRNCKTTPGEELIEGKGQRSGKSHAKKVGINMGYIWGKTNKAGVYVK